MKTLGYYNGVYGELDDMKVSYNDRGCYFGDGIYDVAYCYNHKIFNLSEHIDRFFSAADYIGISLNFTKKYLFSLIYDLSSKVESERQVVYWQATRGTMVRDHLFPDDIIPNLWITIKPGELRDMSNPIKVTIEKDLRHSLCNIKSLNLLPNVLAINRADKKRCQEVIFHREGRITECAHSNVSILKDGFLITPPADNYILAGTGRALLMKKAKEMGISIEEKVFYIDDINNADEIIITAAGSLCIDVEDINGRKVGGKDRYLLRELRNKIVADFNDFTGASVEVDR